MLKIMDNLINISSHVQVPWRKYSNGICQYEGKYVALNKNLCHFWNRFFPIPGTKSKAHKQIQIDGILRAGFFSGERAR